MKPVTQSEVVNEQSGVLKEISFGIKKENYHIIFNFLRNQAYKDPVRAVLREYACNSADIHSQQNISRPFEVSLPTELDSTLRIRDFGKALTDKEIATIYCSYGESTKRDDNTQTGMLGLGSKSGFAYGDSFLVNVYRQGKMTTWNAYIDPSQEGKMAQMNTEPTNEPDGLEIVIPVKGEDVYEFRQKAIQRVFPYFEQTPIIKNITPEEKSTLQNLIEKTSTFKGKDWTYFGSGESVAIMANVGYPIDVDAFTDQEITPAIKKFLRGGLRVKFENGSLEFAISRESLQYTPHTKKNILARLNEIGDEITEMAEAKFKGCKTLWDSKLLWKDVFRLDGSLYSVRELFDKKLKFNGQPLNDPTFSCEDFASDIELSCYSKRGYGWNREKVARTSTLKIEVDARSFVAENDTSICNGIINRVVGLIEGKRFDKVYVIKFKDATVKANWIQATGFDYPLDSLTKLPKEPLSKYYGTTNGVASFGNIKHTSKEFTFSRKGNNQANPRSYSSRNSDYWTPTDVDLKDDEGIYLKIDRFQYLMPDGCHVDPHRLSDLMAQLESIGVELPKVIYGFKESSALKAKQNPAMIEFWKWLDDAIAELFKNNPKLEQDYANRFYCLGKIQQAHYDLTGLGKLIMKWTSIKATSQLAVFFDKLHLLSKYDEEKLHTLGGLIHLTSYKVKQTPSFELLAEYQALEERYPLLFNTTKSLGSGVVTQKTWKQPLEEYVALVDMATP